jgi:predicted NAD-dependent protein-ADP-ribosyltransferase YbiA (DUF1768 family)
MHVLLKNQQIVLIPTDERMAAELAAWKRAHRGHVLLVREDDGSGMALADLGPQADACREPLNVTSMAADPAVTLIGNFAATPFFLDGEHYASVEGFWQGLKFADRGERRRVAMLDGAEAKRAGTTQGYAPTVEYLGREVAVGTWDHWQLMRRACEAKFTQHGPAREALLATGERPLEHRVRHDSHAIPGVIVADIWMDVRRTLRSACASHGSG